MASPSRLRAAALPWPRTTALTTAAVLLAALLAGCGDDDVSTGATASLASLTTQTLDWTACPAPDEAEGGGTAPSPLPNGATWECATMRAPLDWSRPQGSTIGISLIRARASGPASERIGSLIFNFGGPGGSGVTALPAFVQDY
ncbi:alpha/beta hydrolase, partial [Streptomyces sp. SID6137]|nr:alpha/beta hydrolase [Streptomyces sp. SID6137]